MTFNIYNWNKSEEHLRRICDVLKRNSPDTVGFQEITPEWIDRILADGELGKRYGYVGEPRGDFTKEMTAIFYRRDRFRVLESATKWYSDTPDVASNYGVSGQQYNRILTYAVTERLSDGKRFAHVNTHLDLWVYFGEHKEEIPLLLDDGELVQNRQVRMLAEVCLALRETGYPVVLTGDFNSKVGSYVYRHLAEKGFVRSEDIAEETEGSCKGLPVCQVLDHVYLGAETPHCEKYRIDDTRYDEELKAPVGHYPSDHLPRMATIKI